MSSVLNDGPSEEPAATTSPVRREFSAFRPIRSGQLLWFLRWFWLIQAVMLGFDVGLFRFWLGIDSVVRLGRGALF